MEHPDDAGVDPRRQRRRKRRRFAAQLTPVAVLLLLAGVLFTDEDGALGVVGLVALAQGIGLAVALVWLAAGHNPLSRRDLRGWMVDSTSPHRGSNRLAATDRHRPKDRTHPPGARTRFGR
jgi:hypothetical protein